MNEITLLEKQMYDEALTLKGQAQAIAVTDHISYQAAGEFAKGLKELKKKVTEYFEPLKEAAHKAHKAVTQREKEELKPIEDADQLIRQGMSAYLNEQERIRKEEQRKLEAEAKIAADKERERLLSLAVKNEEKGEDEKAAEYLKKAEQVYVEPVFAAPVEKTIKTDAGNITAAKDVRVTVIDIKALVSAVAVGQVPITIIDIKQSTLKSWLKSSGIRTVPGCKVEDVLGVRI